MARAIGYGQVSVSHEVSPMMKLVSRGDTTVVDAYLSPILRRYVEQVASELEGVRLMFMQSNGGLTDARRFQGKDSILSGPAGGIVGAVRTRCSPASTRSSLRHGGLRPTYRTMPANSSAPSKRRSPACACARR